MNINKSDSKGRIKIDGGGNAYIRHESDGGVITLTPLPEVPIPITLPSDSLEAIYVNPSKLASENSTIAISIRASFQDLAMRAVRLSELLDSPIVVESSGLGSVVYGMIQSEMLNVQSDQAVIQVRKSDKRA